MSAKTPKRWEVAIAALLSERTIEAAASKANVSVRALKNWLALPAFKDQYRKARTAILERTISRLLALHEKALDALEKNLACDSPAAVNRAVELVLAHTNNGLQTLDLAEQIAELKAQVEQEQQPRPPVAFPEEDVS